jgi:hypothetical protein
MMAVVLEKIHINKKIYLPMTDLEITTENIDNLPDLYEI